MDENQKIYNSIPCYSKIEPIKPVNDEFTLCKVYVAATGCNRNYSYISKAAMDAAMPSLPYIPVVGHLMTKYDEDGNEIGKYFGGHDYMWDENWNYVAQTVPFGVVVDDSFAYETVNEYGKELEYLTANAVLWTGRYPALKEAVYSDDTWFGQSMEIVVDQSRPYSEDSNFTEILEYTYSALCILGKSDDPEYHTEPCFISSKFVPINYNLERDQFNKDMCEMQERLAFMLSPEKGGKTPMDMEKTTSILSEFNLTVDAVDFDCEGMDEDALRAAAQAFVDSADNNGGNSAVTTTPDDNQDSGAEFVCEFAATYNQRRDALTNALDDVVVRDMAGNVVSATSYWVNDFDDQYVYVERYVYQVDGDCTDDHGRFAYAFNDADCTATISGEFEPMFLMWLTSDEKQKLETSRNAFEDLQQYKEENERAKRKASIDSLFEQFEDLQSVDGFDDLRSSAYESGEIDEIETKLYAMRGRLSKSFSKQQKTGVVKVGFDNDHAPENTNTYGGLLKKH